MDPLEYLNHLVCKPLCYGLKSPDSDLYDFGFGDPSAVYILHIICRFKVIWKNGEQRVRIYHENTPCEQFHAEIKPLLGLPVKRVALSDKNDLWLDFGDCWVVFATFENEEESWRFFSADSALPHLIAADSRMYFSG